MPISPSARVVFTSVADEAAAESLARTLVGERLAACVTRLPGARSTYRWKDKVEEATEVFCIIKTQGDRVDALLARLRELHSYEVPEGLTLAVEGGLPDYLAWLEATTR